MTFPIPPGVASLLGLEPETWQDRIREGAYTSPKGTRIIFAYEDLGREFEKRTTAFDYPGVNGSYVQQNGYSSRRYPMRCIFAGSDHDRIATAFEAALLEDGVGVLEHPIYGKLDVVPYGSVSRRDALKNEANQSIVEVTFWTTLGVVYPSAGKSAQNEILAAIDGFDVEAAQQFDESMSLTDTLNKANAMATIRKFLRDVQAVLQGASDAVLSVNRQFRDLQSLVNFGLDVLIGQPLQLALQVSNLIKAPARALSGLESRLESYGRLAERILSSSQAMPTLSLANGANLSSRTKRIANDFHISDLFAMNAVAGSVLCVAAGEDTGETPFTTKPQALQAAEAIEEQFTQIADWRDTSFRALEEIPNAGPAQIDTGGAYQALQQAVALAQGYLVQISFTLVPERRIVLDRPRTIVDLAAELYGTVDSRLDFLISTNDLTGSEILELPRGRSIVYYP